MGGIHKLPDPSDTEREAGAWLARLEADDVSDADRRRFAEWKAAHPAHARTYDGLRTTWAELTANAPLVRAVTFGQAMIDAGRPVHRRRRWIAAAAGVALVVVGAVVWRAGERPSEAFETTVGEHADVGLADGSRVELNGTSRIRVEYSTAERVLKLERGEAYFQVAHDSTRPFWVVADGSWIRAVGTAFNVDIRPSGVRVTVSEGVVKVGHSRPDDGRPSDGATTFASATASAGEQVDLSGLTVSVRRLKPGDVGRSTGWRQGKLYFDDEPLSDVVAELARYSNLRVVFRKPAIARLPVGGSFEASSQGMEALLAMLKDGLGLEVTQQDAAVSVDGRPALLESPPERSPGSSRAN